MDDYSKTMKNAIHKIRQSISDLTLAHYRCFCESGDYDEPYQIRRHIETLRVIEDSLKPHAKQFERDFASSREAIK